MGELLLRAVAISLPPAGGICLSSHLFKNAKTVNPLMGLTVFGASDVTRTRDLLITSEMHYRLCYTSKI